MTKFKHSQRVMLALVLLLSAALILPILGRRSFWYDEAYSWWFTTIKLKDVVPTAWNQEEFNMVLYYGLLNIWSRWGDTEFWLRLPSALFAVGAVWATARLGSVLFEPRVALTAALLVGLDRLVINYGQEARAYSMLLFLATLSSYFLVCALKEDKWRYWFGFVVIGVLCGYTQLFGVVQVFSQVAVVGLLVYLASARVAAGLLIAAGFVLLGTLPLVWYVLTATGRGLSWIPPAAVEDLAVIMTSLAGGYGRFAWVILLAILPLVIVGFVKRYREQTPIAGGGSFSPVAYVVLCVLVPIASAFAISLITQPLTQPRYLIATVAPLMLAAAVGIWAIPQRALRAAALVVVMSLAFGNTLRAVATRANSGQQDLRSATAFLLEHSAPGDALMFCEASKLGFDYYARHATSIPSVIYPRSSAPYRDDEPYFGNPGALVSPDDLIRLAAGYDRVWMLCTFRREGPLLAAFEKSRLSFEDRGFWHVRVVGMRKRD